MPERQSSPGEVTARPEAGADGNGHAAAGTDDAAATPAARPSPRPRPEADEALTERVADQVAAEPGAAEPAAADPADEPPAAGQAVATGDAAAKPAADPPTVRAEPPQAAADRPRPSPAPPAGQAGTAGRPDPAGEQPTVTRPGGGNGWFTSWDSEATQVFPAQHRGAAAAGASAPHGSEQPTDVLPLTAGAAQPPPPGGPGAGPDGDRPGRSRRLLVVAGVLAVLALLYVGDLAFSAGSVPRGVTVAGVSIGGLDRATAEERLRAQIEPRTTQPIAIGVGEVRTEIDPAAAGLAVDWQGTLDRAGSQPLNPITRLTSFFTDREVGVVTTADPEAVASALEQIAPVVDRPPVEGSVDFDGTTPVPVQPVPGQELDLPAATQVLQRDWATGELVELPLIELAPLTTPEDVTAAIEEVARPAVSAPVTILGEQNTRGVLEPTEIAGALSFRADPAEEGLVPEINQEAVVDAVSEGLAPSERPGRDASLDFGSGTPVVVPSQDGRGIDYDATLADLLDVLTGDGPREITAIYADQPAELTTEELEGLGIQGVIGEFTTGGFAQDSGMNIRRAAEQIDGMIVEPGETFSLNEATVPRNAANGYVPAGIIEDGRPQRGIGGGVSQVATTLFNAAYFAGMTDVYHQEHSFYISRYPAGREATVFEGAIDLKFRNDNETGVLIETEWTPSSITIRLYGTKRYEVTSASSPRTDFVEPNTVTIPAGEPCNPSEGAPGFTITDTRTMREISTGEVRTNSHTVKYNPSPTVVCGG